MDPPPAQPHSHQHIPRRAHGLYPRGRLVFFSFLFFSLPRTMESRHLPTDFNINMQIAFARRCAAHAARISCCHRNYVPQLCTATEIKVWGFFSRATSSLTHWTEHIHSIAHKHTRLQCAPLTVTHSIIVPRQIGSMQCSSSQTAIIEEKKNDYALECVRISNTPELVASPLSRELCEEW